MSQPAETYFTSERIGELGRAVRSLENGICWLGMGVKKAKISAVAHRDPAALTSDDNQRLIEAIVAYVPELLVVLDASLRLDIVKLAVGESERGKA